MKKYFLYLLGQLRLIFLLVTILLLGTNLIVCGQTSSTFSRFQLTLTIDGPTCGNYITRNTANGLINNAVHAVQVVGDTIYAGTYGGLSISTDGGNSFTSRTTANGLGNNYVQDLYVEGKTVYAATSGGLSISTDGGNTFLNKTKADGLGSNEATDVFVVSGPVSTTIYAVTEFGGLSISTDGGHRFTNRTTTNGLGSNGAYCVYVVGNTVYVGTFNGLSISNDGGNSFINITPSTGTGLVTAIIPNIYVQGENIYIGCSYGVIISTDGGRTFGFRNIDNRVDQTQVYNIYAIGRTIYASSWSGLYISTDRGDNFINYTPADGLGSNDVLDVFVSGKTIYVATYGGVSFCSEGSPLPVNLTGFSAHILNQTSVQLQWATATEKDNAYFRLERSKDLHQVESMAQVPALEADGGQGHLYSFIDQQPHSGTSYYRLWQVDRSGRSTAYPWIPVMLDTQAYGVFPNPIRETTFTLHLDEPQTAQIRFYGVHGQSISFQKVSSQENNLVLKSKHKLSPGVYIIQVDERGQTRQHRLMVE